MLGNRLRVGGLGDTNVVHIHGMYLLQYKKSRNIAWLASLSRLGLYTRCRRLAGSACVRFTLCEKGKSSSSLIISSAMLRKR